MICQLNNNITSKTSLTLYTLTARMSNIEQKNEDGVPDLWPETAEK
jgi:predicted transcriptional regulator YdeE